MSMKAWNMNKNRTFLASSITCAVGPAIFTNNNAKSITRLAIMISFLNESNTFAVNHFPTINKHLGPGFRKS